MISGTLYGSLISVPVSSATQYGPILCPPPAQNLDVFNWLELHCPQTQDYQSIPQFSPSLYAYLCFVFWELMLRYAQGLLLALPSGIILAGSGDHIACEERTWVGHLQVPYPLYCCSHPNLPLPFLGANYVIQVPQRQEMPSQDLWPLGPDLGMRVI